MEILETPVWVVLRKTRGESLVVAAFTTQYHAERFIAKLKTKEPGSYKEVLTTIWNFQPSESEQGLDFLTE